MKKIEIISLVIIFLIFVPTVFFLKDSSSERNDNYNINTVSWDIYKDMDYNFSVSYPFYLEKNTSFEDSSEEKKHSLGNLLKSVSFSYNGLGLLGVKIYSDLDFNNLDEFMSQKNKQNEFVRYKIEKNFVFNGFDAIIFHTVSVPPKDSNGNPVSVEEHFSSEKKLVFIKNNKLFEIWTRFGDESLHQKAWDSFRFLD